MLYEPPSSRVSRTTPCRLDLAGIELHLLPERAVHAPALHTVLLADLHLGKGDAFRRAGIALPRGGTRQDLERLSDLIARHRPTQVIVLGDLIHGPVPADAAWRSQWRGLLDRHAHVHFAAVRGNHDRALRDARQFEGVSLLDAGVELGPLRLHHEPPENGALRSDSSEATAVVCGHLHPVVRVRQPGLPSRLPVFWLRGQRLVLPAFSAFTGGFALQPAAGDRIWLCADDNLRSLQGPDA